MFGGGGVLSDAPNLLVHLRVSPLTPESIRLPPGRRGCRSISDDSDHYPTPDEYISEVAPKPDAVRSIYCLAPASSRLFTALHEAAKPVWDFVDNDYTKARCFTINRASIISGWQELRNLKNLHYAFIEIDRLEEQRDLQREAYARDLEFADNRELDPDLQSAYTLESWMVPSS